MVNEKRVSAWSYLVKKQKAAIKRFRAERPEICKQLSNAHILCLFRLYKKNTERTYFCSNMSFLMAGTLINLICSLFMNVGSNMSISNEVKNESMSN